MNTLSIYSLIALKGSNLHIGHHIISLHGRTKTRLLLEAMLLGGEGGTEGLKRDQLRYKVYQDALALPLQASPSSRLRESQDSSLSKLISRSRSFLKESLRDTEWSSELEWFVYSERERNWKLVQIRA